MRTLVSLGNLSLHMRIGSQICSLPLWFRIFSKWSTSHCNKWCWRACAIKINLAHAWVVVCYCLVILQCNKLIRPIIATPYTTNQWLAWSDFQDRFIFVQALRSCKHPCACNSWSFVYVAIHTRVCQDTHVLMYACVHKPQACHTRVFCVYTFCVRLSRG